MIVKGSHWSLAMNWKVVIAALAVAIALAGGVSVIAPASANAMSEEEGADEEKCVDLTDGSIDPCIEILEEPGGGEVIVIVDPVEPAEEPEEESEGPALDPLGCDRGSIFCAPKECGDPGVICIPDPDLTDDGKFSKLQQQQLEERQSEQARKKSEDRAYAECMRIAKKYPAGSRRPLCPQYCPTKKKYIDPRFDCLRNALTEEHGIVPEKPWLDPLDLKQWTVVVKMCDKAGTAIEALEELRIRMNRQFGRDADGFWDAGGHAETLRQKRGTWARMRCSTYYIEA